MPKPTLPSALWYAQQGARVFPLAPGTKIPHKGTNGVLDATTDELDIRAWWRRWPESNIGLACGHGFDVLDIDDWAEANPVAKVQDIIQAGFGTVTTPHGWHVYVPSKGDRNKHRVLPGCDWRGDGGYVVAPPSRLGPDEDYFWLGEVDLKSVIDAWAARARLKALEEQAGQ